MLCFHLCLSVCLFVRLSARFLKMLCTGFDEFFGWVRRGPRTNQLDFGADPDDLDPGISKSTYIADYNYY